MLTELCEYLRNWFDEGQAKYIGEIEITGGVITARDDLYMQETQVEPAAGQYFRVIGSIFSDGIHVYPNYELPDESFEGAVWLLRIPPEIIALSDDIDAWKAKYMATGSPNMSPYNSESFAGYSYNKGGSGSSASGSVSWQSVFASRLAPWRKI